MKASEALKLTESNAISIESILSGIELCAKNGAQFYIEWKYITTNVLGELLKLGYKVSKCVNIQDGAELTRIEW